ncbi:helix-turn-helix domain-containing protein [Frankia sp. CiP3]|uniref:helix-turn-helix domain-containing protein n=1 Tax=Frankia sp. CiP3 TaxID=2880971 RepID=UPI00272EA2A6|nr:TetR/AcrR family transcriptional regulator [Frankia sp. CiP3]
MTVSTSTGDRGRNGRRGSYDRGRITRDALIAAAERLFAERGLDAVSLREIAAAAGSHNTGAAQYHFGNKEQLLEAIFEHRATVLNARRSVLLAQAAGASDATTRPAGTDAERRAEMARVTAQPTAMVQATVGAIVRPLAELVGHGQYVSFLARLQADHARDHRIRRPDNLTDTTFRQARDMLWHALPALPEPVFRRRFNLAMRMAIAALADYERAHPNEAHVNAAERPATAPADRGLAVPLSAERLDDLVTDLIEAMSGMLAAPSSRHGQTPGLGGPPAPPADSTAMADRPTGR